MAKILSLATNKEKAILPAFEEMSINSNKKGISDLEFFYHLEKNNPLPNLRGRSTVDLVQKYGNLSRSSANFSNYAGLSILLEGNLESKEFGNRVYVDDGFDDSNLESLIYYYENGKLGSHPLSETPKTKVFVVRISEAYVKENSSNFKKFEKSKFQEIKKLGETETGMPILVKSSIVNSEQASNKKMGWPCDDTCDRDCDDFLAENIHRFRSSKDHDPMRGFGEFRFFHLALDNIDFDIVNGAIVINGTPDVVDDPGAINGVKRWRWITYNHTSFIWNTDDDLDAMRYVAYEEMVEVKDLYPLMLQVLLHQHQKIQMGNKNQLGLK